MNLQDCHYGKNGALPFTLTGKQHCVDKSLALVRSLHFRSLSFPYQEQPQESYFMHNFNTYDGQYRAYKCRQKHTVITSVSNGEVV